MVNLPVNSLKTDDVGVFVGYYHTNTPHFIF
jgi:hypothetical protein